MMTEEEARQKWCPMARVSFNGTAVNRGLVTHCIASECMMWRWQLKPLRNPLTGHCGLAGK